MHAMQTHGPWHQPVQLTVPQVQPLWRLLSHGHDREQKALDSMAIPATRDRHISANQPLHVKMERRSLCWSGCDRHRRQQPELRSPQNDRSGDCSENSYQDNFSSPRRSTKWIARPTIRASSCSRPQVHQLRSLKRAEPVTTTPLPSGDRHVLITRHHEVDRF
ncbi:unannotated protein [freshwater metagenome]|uniref:Unannotated protein n=1 Tax=freshwater metagenome TaxID=449393 RepID=A0A6J6SEQ6_9ZZZZ